MATNGTNLFEKQSLKTVLVNNLASKDVECHVRLTIHTITELPLVAGAFRVRWKFRHVDSKAAKQQQKAQAAKAALTAPLLPMSDLARQMQKENMKSGNQNQGMLLMGAPANALPVSAMRQNSLPLSEKTVAYSAEEKGHTPFMKLRTRDHTVTLEHTVDVVARMRVVKGELIGEPLKLVVEQVCSIYQFPRDACSDWRVRHSGSTQRRKTGTNV